jgi:hypothetical protein
MTISNACVRWRRNDMDYKLLEATVLCRAAADKLSSAANREKTVLFPDWDEQRMPADERSQTDAIRRVAAAIVGGNDADQGTRITLGELASLIYYVADMLEE